MIISGLAAIGVPFCQASLQQLPVLTVEIGQVACLESGTRVDSSGDVRRALHRHEIGLIRHRYHSIAMRRLNSVPSGPEPIIRQRVAVNMAVESIKIETIS